MRSKLKNKKGVKMKNENYVTIDVIADYLGFKKKTIYEMICKKTLPYYKPFGKKVYFKLAEIDELLQQSRCSTCIELETQAANYIVNKNKKGH